MVKRFTGGAADQRRRLLVLGVVAIVIAVLVGFGLSATLDNEVAQTYADIEIVDEDPQPGSLLSPGPCFSYQQSLEVGEPDTSLGMPPLIPLTDQTPIGFGCAGGRPPAQLAFTFRFDGGALVLTNSESFLREAGLGGPGSESYELRKVSEGVYIGGDIGQSDTDQMTPDVLFDRLQASRQ